MSPAIPAKMPDDTLKIYQDQVGGYSSGLGIVVRTILIVVALAILAFVLILAIT